MNSGETSLLNRGRNWDFIERSRGGKATTRTRTKHGDGLIGRGHAFRSLLRREELEKSIAKTRRPGNEINPLSFSLFTRCRMHARRFVPRASRWRRSCNSRSIKPGPYPCIIASNRGVSYNTPTPFTTVATRYVLRYRGARRGARYSRKW